MAIVDLGDGSTLEVPDNLTPKQIQGVVARVMRAKSAESKPTVNMDPTAGMSGTQKFLAGAGKSLYDIGRGVGQVLGVVPQSDIDEAAKLDRPLMKTGAGMAGNVVGGTAALLPLMAVPGANTVGGSAVLGGIVSGLAPVETGQDRVKNAATGAMVGGAVAAGTRLVPALAKALIDPFREKGRQQIAAKAIERFSQGGTPYNAKTPGWNPTLAQATQDPGLAVLERGAASASPDVAASLATRGVEQNSAALKAVQQIAGTEKTRAMARGMRDYMAGFYDDAMTSGVDAKMAKALKPQIDNLMQRPSIQKAIGEAKGLFDEQTIALTKTGDVRGLQVVRQALDDMLDKAKADPSRMGKNELKALMDTRKDLVSVMEQIAPKLREADRVYATFSRPVNEMEVGREIEKKLVPALMDGQAGPAKVTAERYAAVLRDLDEKIPKMAGYPGATVDNTLSPGNLKLLEGVKSDLANRAAAQESARGVGSNTAQNLATQNIMANILGPMGMPQGFASQMASSVLGRTAASPFGLVYNRAAEQAVQQELARALLDPVYANAIRASAARPPLPYPVMGTLDRLSSAAVPMAVVGTRNSQ